MKSAWIVCGAMCALSSNLIAQQAPTTTAKYGVRGWFQGDEMIPWESELTVGDTTLDGAAARLVRYRSRFEEGQWRFDDLAVLATDTWRVRSLGKGRRGDSPSEMAFAGGTITGSTHAADALKPRSVVGAAIPQFALPAWLAARALQVGDTVRVTVVRCLGQQGTDAIELQPFVGVVRAATFTRTSGGVAEDVWEVESQEGFVGSAIIARRDGAVLQFTTPQGSVGHSVDTIRP